MGGLWAAGHCLCADVCVAARCVVDKNMCADCFVIWPFCLHNQLCLKVDERHYIYTPVYVLVYVFDMLYRGLAFICA